MEIGENFGKIWPRVKTVNSPPCHAEERACSRDARRTQSTFFLPRTTQGSWVAPPRREVTLFRKIVLLSCV
ncbi:hypothetical protein HanRHA438_Chr02g0086851 [Helianthus annuus]|nr:hypothetical protein HanRHA438_Chr02g0086851 [Helianthus annuus]